MKNTKQTFPLQEIHIYWRTGNNAIRNLFYILEITSAVRRSVTFLYSVPRVTAFCLCEVKNKGNIASVCRVLVAAAVFS
jgi:hypothetical protein